MQTIQVQTQRRHEMVEITDKLKALVRGAGVESGVMYLHVPHTTAGVTINENADRDVVTDILFKMKEVIDNDRRFQHGEGNSDAHIKSSLFGPTLNLLIEHGALQLGTWQGVYFCEFDGPRTRKVWVKIV